MEGICRSGMIDKRIILFLEQGDDLSEIARKVGLSLGSLKVILIDLAKREIKISEAIDKKIYLLARHFIAAIIYDFLHGKSIYEISNTSGISMNYIKKIIDLEGIHRPKGIAEKISKSKESVTELKQIVRKTSRPNRKIYYLTKKFGLQILKMLKEGSSIKEVSKETGLTHCYIQKILSQLLKKKIINTTSIVKLRSYKQKYHYLTDKFGMHILEKLKEGKALQGISNELNISTYQLSRVLKILKTRKIIKTDKVIDLKPRLNKNRKERILLVKKLYDELGTLENVSKALNLTRERVRQLLLKGEENNLFIYKDRANKKIEDIARQISKDDIIKDLILYGSIEHLENSFNLHKLYIQKLLDFYSIDVEYIKRLSKGKRDLKQYQNIVDFLGYHPTTTELSKKKEWRNLWHRIYHKWGRIDNFRKEYGIPIPQKGYSKFREKAIPKGIEALRRRGQEIRNKYKIEVLALLDKQRGNKLAAYKIAGLINKNEMTVRRCLLELSKENKIEVIKEPKGAYYFLKGNILP